MENNTILDYEEEQGVQIQEIEPVSKETRFANYMIDLILFYVVYFVSMLTLFINSEFLQTLANNPILDRVMTLVFHAVFMAIQEIAFKGRSVGKFVTGTRVVDEYGYTPDTGTLIQRNLCRAIPFNQLSFLGDRGWHDSISNTYVVKM